MLDTVITGLTKYNQGKKKKEQTNIKKRVKTADLFRASLSPSLQGGSFEPKSVRPQAQEPAHVRQDSPFGNGTQPITYHEECRPSLGLDRILLLSEAA